MKISIIIPVFNSEKYLENCLSSILAQDFKDWECILVDDGSTDLSYKICVDWSEQDGRYVVIHQPNYGVSAARNRGIRSASGSYITFVDSDDVVSPRYLSALSEAILSDDADLAVCGMTIECAGKPIEVKRTPDVKWFPLNSYHIAPFWVLEKNHLLFGPVGKLYKKHLFPNHHAPFDEKIDYGEDLLFNLEYLQRTQSVAIVSEVLYHYRKRENSLSTRFRSDMFDTNYDQWRTLVEFHEKREMVNEQINQYLARRLWGIVYDGLFLFPKIADPSIRYLKRILSIPEIVLLRNYKDCFSCSRWIKQGILLRRVEWFFLYFMIKRQR